MNWTYYVVNKTNNQIIGYADNFIEAYNQALQKGIPAFVLQGSIITELDSAAPQQEPIEQENVEQELEEEAPAE